MGKVEGLYVAPTEPVKLKKIGESSLLPERFGVDVMWAAGGRKFGVQRKRWDDLIASVEDGRWAREIPMMVGKLDECWVVVEGWPNVNRDGQVDRGGWGRRWTVSAIRGVIWSAQMQGVKVGWTKDVADTVGWVQAAVDWSRKPGHGSSMARPGPVGMWGHRDDRDWGVHLLQGLDGVGVELAGRIWDRFGGVPWRWDVGVEELMEVEGVGKVKAEKMMRAIGRDGSDDE